MLLPKRFATNRTKQSGPFGYQKTLLANTAQSEEEDLFYTIRNSIIEAKFKKDITTGVGFYSIKRIDDTDEVINYCKSLWQINVNRAFRIGFPTNIYPSKKYYKGHTQSTSSIEFSWENIPIDPDKNFYVNVDIIASLVDGGESLDISARLSLHPNADGFISDYAICGFHIAPLAFKSMGASDYSEQDVFSYPYKLGQSTINPIKNLRPPRCNSENILYNATRSDSRASFISPGGDPNPFKSQDRAIHMHPGMMTMPMVSYSNRATKQGLLIYLYDTSGYAAKVFNWWSDGDKLHLRFYEAADQEFVNNGVSLYWDDDTTLPHEFVWSVRIKPYLSSTKWTELYAAELYRPIADTLSWIPKPLWERAEEREIPDLIPKTPAYITAWQGTGKAQKLINGVEYWRDTILSNNPSVDDVSLFTHMHTFNFDWIGEGWMSFATGQGATGGETRSPDYLPINDYWDGVFPQILSLAKTPITPYWVYSFTIQTGSNWLQEVSGYDLIKKSVEEASLTRTGTGDYDYPSYRYSCISPEVNNNKSIETVSGLAVAGATSYRDVFGAYTLGCYAENHVWTESGVNHTHSHPQSLYSTYWNKKQIQGVSGWNDVINENMNSIWRDVHGSGFTDVAFLSDSEYMCDAHIKFISLGITSSPSNDRYSNRTFDTGFSPIVVGSLASSYIIPTPTWQETSPLFNIVHGNRVFNHNLLGHFGTSTSIKDSSNFWLKEPLGIITGDPTKPYMPATGRLATELEHVENLKGNMIYEIFGLGTSVTITQWDPQVLNNITEDATGWMTGDYTGLLSFGKDLIRCNQAVPEYLLEGSITYPLSSFTSALNYVWISHELSPKQTAKYHGNRTGEHAVIHSVRKHRSDPNKLLVAFCNWTNTDQSYQGIFDPSDYGFTKNYDIYSIDYSLASAQSGSLGARSIFASGILPGDTYTFETTGSYLVPAGGIELYEIVLEPTESSTVELSSLRENFTKVRYSYSVKDIYSDSIGIAYSYSSICDNEISNKHIGFRAAATQNVVNNLPPWMATRKTKDSNGWKLVNSWGMAIENIIEYSNYGLKNIFLSTADRSQRSLLYKGSVHTEEVFNFDPSRNMLLNSAFSMRDSARLNLPYAWSDYRIGPRKVFLNTDDTVVGSHSVKLISGGSISQLKESSTVADNYTFSFYYKPIGPVSISAAAIFETINGKTYSKEINIVSSDSVWNRKSVTVNCSDQIYRYQVVIKNNYGEALIDCLQLEKGSTATAWQSFDGDYPSYIENTIPFKHAQAITKTKKISMYPVGNRDEFKFINIPTRVELKIPKNIDLEPYGDLSFGRVTDFFKNSYPLNWRIKNNKIQQIDANNIYEVYKEFDLKDIRYYQGRGEGVAENLCNYTYNMMASAIYKDLLFVVSKETYRDNTVLVLKIVVPRDPPNGETYLECISDIELSTSIYDDYGLGTNETVTSIGFSEVDSSWMVINTSIGRRFYYKMYFDYYFVNLGTRAIYALEDYGNSQIQIS